MMAKKIVDLMLRDISALDAETIVAMLLAVPMAPEEVARRFVTEEPDWALAQSLRLFADLVDQAIIEPNPRRLGSWRIVSKREDPLESLLVSRGRYEGKEGEDDA